MSTFLVLRLLHVYTFFCWEPRKQSVFQKQTGFQLAPKARRALSLLIAVLKAIPEFWGCVFERAGSRQLLLLLFWSKTRSACRVLTKPFVLVWVLWNCQDNNSAAVDSLMCAYTQHINLFFFGFFLEGGVWPDCFNEVNSLLMKWCRFTTH